MYRQYTMETTVILAEVDQWPIGSQSRMFDSANGIIIRISHGRYTPLGERLLSMITPMTGSLMASQSLDRDIMAVTAAMGISRVSVRKAMRKALIIP